MVLVLSLLDLLEQQNAPKHVFDNAWEVPGWILGLTGRDGNGLSAAI